MFLKACDEQLKPPSNQQMWRTERAGTARRRMTVERSGGLRRFNENLSTGVVFGNIGGLVAGSLSENRFVVEVVKCFGRFSVGTESLDGLSI